MKIWLISVFEQTPVDMVFSTRFISIAEAAIKRGHDVTFFASTFKHNTKNQRYDKDTIISLNDKYRLIFVKSLSYQKNISIKRLYSHQIFSKHLIKEIKRAVKPDVILLAFPPISLAYEITKWASKENIPVIVDIIDPWPDIFRKSMSIIPSRIQDFVLFPMTRRLKSVFKRASAVIAISNQYINWAKGYYPEIANSKCYYPAVKFNQIQEQLKLIGTVIKKDTSKFRVIYAGSLASSYDLSTILKAAEILNSKYGKAIEFVIAGAGPQEKMIQEYLKVNTNLRYLGRLSKEDLMKEYFLSDIGLTQHIKGATQSVTYKLFDLLACGLPIMNSLESEMKHIILENKVGLFNPPGDAVILAGNIEYCYRNRLEYETFKINALDLAARLGDADVVYEDVLNFMEELIFK